MIVWSAENWNITGKLWCTDNGGSEETGLSVEELRARSFMKILKSRAWIMGA